MDGERTYFLRACDASSAPAELRQRVLSEYDRLQNTVFALACAAVDELCPYFARSSRVCLPQPTEPRVLWVQPSRKRRRKSRMKPRQQVRRPASAVTAEAAALLQEWFDAHLCWPYPTEAEKAELAERACINVAQVSTWFSNRRLRYKQEALEEVEEDDDEEEEEDE